MKIYGQNEAGHRDRFDGSWTDIKCDKCGKQRRNESEAWRKLIWYSEPAKLFSGGGEKDYCPDCQSKEQKERVTRKALRKLTEEAKYHTMRIADAKHNLEITQAEIESVRKVRSEVV
jgi:hypothetical protein